MSLPGNVTALTFVFEHDPFGEPGTRVPDHAPGSVLYCSGSRASANPLSAATTIPAAGFSAPAQQENLMMPGSQCRRFSSGRRELRQHGHRAIFRKFLLFTEA
jgi:hypothetical protein